MDSLETHILIFAAAGAVIGLAGTRLSGLADRLADLTGIGEALMGAVFLGATTSLPGITASVVAAADGHATLALANALGGIAVQTAFLAVADLAYRKANLEHAAASVPNLMFGALLTILLSLLMAGMIGPQVSVLGVHPVTPLLFATYGLGMRMVLSARNWPMWRPRVTGATRTDVPDSDTTRGPTVIQTWLAFVAIAVVVALAGTYLVRSAEVIAAETGISESVVGGALVAITTSLPELVTSVAAVRRGALTLAVGAVLGGNAFDTLFAAVADIAYRDGSIYQGATARELTLLCITLVMTGTLLLGMLRRERRGPANIGFESVLLLVLYGLSLLLLRYGG